MTTYTAVPSHTTSSFVSYAPNSTCVGIARTTIPADDCDFHVSFFRGFFVFSIFFIIYGVFNNSVLLYIIFSNGREMRTLPNIFIGNMATLGIIFLVVDAGGEAALISQIAFQVEIFHNGTLDQIMFIIQTFVGVASFSTLAVLAVDRYLAIVHPVRSKAYRTKKRAIIACLFVWIIAGLCLIPILVSGSTPNIFEVVDNPAYKPSLIIFVILAYFIPLIVIVLCYSAILKVVWWNPMNLQLTDVEQKRRLQQRIQVSKTIAIVVGLFVVFYGYLFSVMIWIVAEGFLHVSLRVRNSVLFSAILCVFMVTSINPVVYALHQPGFRPYVYKLFCRRCKCAAPLKERSLRTSIGPSSEPRQQPQIMIAPDTTPHMEGDVSISYVNPTFTRQNGESSSDIPENNL